MKHTPINKPPDPRHLFLCGDKGAIVEVPRDFTGDDWGRIQREFAVACRHKDPDNAPVKCPQLYWDQNYHGVYYSWGLTGPGGGWYELYNLPDTPEASVKACRREIKIRFDAVSVHVYKVSQLIDFTVSRATNDHVQNTVQGRQAPDCH